MMKIHLRKNLFKLILLTVSCFLSIRAVAKPEITDAQAAQTVARLAGTPVTVLPLVDTYVIAGKPNEARASSRIVATGYETAQDTLTLRSLLQFNLTAIPIDSEITEATLRLYLSGSTGPAVGMSVSIYQVTSTWNESINWTEHLTLNVAAPISTTTVVGTDLTWYEWDVSQLVQKWIKSPEPASYLGIMLKGDESPSRHQRAFWSKDCTGSDCEGKLPYLTISYNPPTPTPTQTATALPTATPTLTPTPTSTPTPTRGMAYLQLQVAPTHALTVGDRVTYTIAYAAIDYPASTYELTDITITNKIPANLALIPNALPTADELYTVSHTGDTAGARITWVRKRPLKDNERGTVSYQAQWPTPTATFVPTAPPTPGGVQVTIKSTPIATPNAPIVYTLVVRNTGTATVTVTTLRNQIPEGAVYVAGGEREGNVVEWTDINEVGAGQVATRAYVVRAAQTITNSIYSVTLVVDGNKKELAGGPPFVTLIGPNVLPPPGDDRIIQNNGATIYWRVEGRPSSLRSSPIFNPLYQRYLPEIRGD